MTSPTPTTLISTQTLLANLADTTQLLSLQTAPSTPLKFNNFHTLPTELRLSIWHLTFPGTRHISLLPTRKPRRKKKHHPECHCLPTICTHHPIALFINRESRAEVLKHYRCYKRDIILHNQKSGSTWIYYRIARDIFFIPSQSILPNSTLSGWPGWTTSLAAQNATFIQALKTIEIRGWDWDSRICTAYENGEVVLLDRFEGLEKVVLVLGRGAFWDFRTFGEGWDEFGVLGSEPAVESLAGMEGYLRGVAERFPGRGVPRVEMVFRDE